METIRVQQTVAKDGEISVSGLPYRKGQSVEIVVLPQIFLLRRPPLTVRQFRQSALIGMWKDRDDIQDSSVYARQLREAAHRRSHNDWIVMPDLLAINKYQSIL